MTACAEKTEPAPEPAAEPGATAAAEPAAEMPASEEESARDEAFIDHMAAYWLSGHQEVSGIKEEWRPFLEGMREAARAVEEAGDLDSARAAAERINDNCQGCHNAAGVND